MENFYTSVTAFGNEILVRGYNNGVSFTKKVNYQPSLYLKTVNNPTSIHRTIFDEPLKKHTFKTIKEAKEWAKGQESEHSSTYGCDKYHYQYLADEYLGKNIQADFSLIQVSALDIETTVHHTGKMPSVFNPLEEILLLTFIDSITKKKTVFGRKPYKTEDRLVTYHYIENEKEMLLEVIAFFKKSKFDIITGWNSYGFDIPYICARIGLLLGEKILDQLSPFGKVWARDGKDDWGNPMRTYNIVGISQLDYMLLYKKFNKEKQESYKLGHIGFVELGKPKLDLGVSFYEAYTEHWDKYVLYNIIDTEIVDELENKKAFIRLAVMMAHLARCSFEDTLGTVSMWESIIYNDLLLKNVIIPMKNDKPPKFIVGAVVKEPIPGLYKWVMGVDATSLYPSIMMMLNMSPETIIKDEFVNMTIPEFMAMKQHNNLKTVACNGHVFDNTKRGFIPVLVEKYFNLRVQYKDIKKESEQKAEDFKLYLNDDNQKEYSLLLSKAEINDLYQKAVKEIINGLYGAMANKHFIFFDTRIAEGITMTGQAIIQYTQNKINDYLNEIVGGEFVDYVIMGDTDSAGFTLAPLLKKFYQGKTDAELLDIVSMIGKKRIEPYLNRVCDEFTSYLNGNVGKLRFKREKICIDFLITGKKRYCTKVLDNEYVRYKEPKYEIVGLSCIATTCPAVCKVDMKNAIKKIMDGASNQEITQFNIDFKKTFFKQLPKDISIPKGVSGVDKYSNGNGFIDNTPIQSRAAILFNRLVQKHKLEAEYPRIMDGDKIKYVYLTMPNPIGQNVVGFVDKIPEQFGLNNFIDYELMYEKTYMSQMTSIMESIGWVAKDKGMLDW